MTGRGASAPIPVMCAQCGRMVALTPRAHVQRGARDGAHLLGAHCLGDGWLRTWQGSVAAEDLWRADDAGRYG